MGTTTVSSTNAGAQNQELAAMVAARIESEKSARKARADKMKELVAAKAKAATKKEKSNIEHEINALKKEAEKAKVGGKTKAPAKPTVTKIEAVKATKVAFTGKDLSAANSALKNEFRKLSHVCKYVGKFTKAEIIAALKAEDSKVDAGKVEAIASAYWQIISQYDLIAVVAQWLPNIDGVHCVKKQLVLEDKQEPLKSFDRTATTTLLSGEFFKDKGFATPKVATPDKLMPYKVCNNAEPLRLKVYGYIPKVTYSVSDVLNAIKAFAQMGEQKELYVARKVTGNSKKKAAQ